MSMRISSEKNTHTPKHTHTHSRQYGNANKLVYVKFIHKCGRAHDQLPGNWIWISIWICCAPTKNYCERAYACVCPCVCLCIVSYSQKRVICKAVAKHFRQSELLLTLRLQRQWQRQRHRQPGAGLNAGHLAQQAGHEIAEFAINRPARPFKRCCAFTPTTISNRRLHLLPAPLIELFSRKFWTWVTSFKALFAAPYPVFRIRLFSLCNY